MKNYKVIFTARAERQLSGLYAYIAENSGEARAEKYVGGIIADCKALSIFPKRGTKRDDIRKNLRIKGYARSAVVAFSVDAATLTVAIHGVFYGGQNFEHILLETENDH